MLGWKGRDRVATQFEDVIDRSAVKWQRMPAKYRPKAVNDEWKATEPLRSHPGWHCRKEDECQKASHQKLENRRGKVKVRKTIEPPEKVANYVRFRKMQVICGCRSEVKGADSVGNQQPVLKPGNWIFSAK